MHEIKNRWTGAVIFTSKDSETLLQALERAVEEKVNLVGASLNFVRNDFWDVLIRSRDEIPELRKHLVEGKVDGSVYEGECRCLVGTIANIKHCKYDEIEALKPDSTRPIERFFTGISTGDTPETNQISKIVVGWIDELQSLLK
jgi:hypothetical protein